MKKTFEEILYDDILKEERKIVALKRATDIKMVIRFSLNNPKNIYYPNDDETMYENATDSAFGFIKEPILDARYFGSYKNMCGLACHYDLTDLIFKPRKKQLVQNIGNIVTYHKLGELNEFDYSATIEDVLMQIPKALLKSVNAYELVEPNFSDTEITQVINPKTEEVSKMMIARLYQIKNIPENIKEQNIIYQGRTYTKTEIDSL